MPKLDLTLLVEQLRKFGGADLTTTLSGIEKSIHGLTADSCQSFLENARAGKETLAAAAEMKRLAGQIDVSIHALGILRCLPRILEQGEYVEYVSLGAGNTGRAFDLETNYRVAEFKFISWRGGAEAIRQNGVFKDFFLLADSETIKRKYLYLLGTVHALKFLNGGRALDSIFSNSKKVRELFVKRHGDRFKKVSEYYQLHREDVSIEDVSGWLPELANVIVSEADEAS